MLQRRWLWLWQWLWLCEKFQTPDCWRPWDIRSQKSQGLRLNLKAFALTVRYLARHMSKHNKKMARWRDLTFVKQTRDFPDLSSKTSKSRLLVGSGSFWKLGRSIQNWLNCVYMIPNSISRNFQLITELFWPEIVDYMKSDPRPAQVQQAPFCGCTAMFLLE